MKKVSITAIVFFIIIGLAIPFGVVFLIIGHFENKINNEPRSFISRLDPREIFAEEKKEPKPKPLPTPEIVKGVYLTGYSFVNSKTLNRLIELTEETEINSFVIDVKDSYGKLMFTPASEKLKDVPISKMAFNNEEHKKTLDELQEKGIYTIARVTTFQDPTAAKTFPDLALKNTWDTTWQNWQGLTWLDMTNEGAWEIPVEQAKEAIALGYDEIQFDYIRFPSDGNTRQIKYSNFPEDKRKYEILREFYKYAHENLDELNIPLSIDLFGLTYEIRQSEHYDLNIGQRVIDAAPYFDYISPMVYPSHYPTGYLGLKNPAAHPYTVVSRAMLAGKTILENASSTNAQSRPWLQDFDIGADYTASLIRAQIKATEESGASGWLLWNPLNRYTIGGLNK
jgi:hypothetical protein